MKRSLSVLAGGLLLAASFGAQAQAQAPSSDMQLRMDRGFYVSAGVGKSKTGEGCVVNCDNTDRTWNVSAGYMFNRHFGIEAGYADLGTHTTSGFIFGGVATSTVDTTAFELLGVVMFPFNEKFAIYGKAGVFRAKAEAVSSGAVVTSGKENDNGFTIAGGVQWSFTPHIAMFGEMQSYGDPPNAAPGVQKDNLTLWRVGVRARFY